MENASKALLIAGSVLIVILLIAFGMKIFNSTSGSADEIEGTMQTSEITMFNNKFTPYIGKNKTKTDVMSLANIVIASNVSSGRVVLLSIGGYSYNSESTAMINAVSALSTTKKYEIEILSVVSGYIQTLKVKEQV